MVDLDRLARGAEPRTREEFVTIWRIMQERYAKYPVLARSLRERRSFLILQDLPWQGLQNSLYAEYRPILLRLFETGGQAQMDALPNPATKPAAFTIQHPEAERWAREYAAKLVQGLTREAQRAMANTIAEMIRLQVPPEEGARLIRPMLGLTPRYARAVVNFQQDLRNRGFDPDYIEGKANEYSSRLLNARARMVARTETLRSVQEGQRQSFQQAVEQGVLRPDRTRRKWVTAADERTCTTICLPMDGQLTTLTDPWITSVGPLQTPTDSHPSCRCSVVLTFADAEGNFATRAPRSTDTGQPLTPRTLRPQVRRAP